MRKIFIYIEGELEDGTKTLTINQGQGRFPRTFTADAIELIDAPIEPKSKPESGVKPKAKD